MNTDQPLPERLRMIAMSDIALSEPYAQAMFDAADEIDRLRAELDALRRDAERLDWIAAKVAEECAVWLLPSGESLRFVQVRHGGQGCQNYPTAEGLRPAIDAAMKETP